jgi:NAD(P)-dependent dehydrogenase (short-subunit alcohol dehydrogenase family)
MRAIVTGAASGIGAAVVTRFKTDGARVAGIDVNHEKLQDSALAFRSVTDLADPTRVERAVNDAANALGGVDVLVTCAGAGTAGTVIETALEDWERVFAVNVRAVFLAAKAAIPHMRRAGGGAIVNVASAQGLVGVGNNAAYCASKGAVIQLTRAMAIDHAAEGIRVNAVCPGPTKTPMLESYFASRPDPRAERERTMSDCLHRRLIQPAEIADAIAYLASPRAASTIGSILVVDGGATAK